MSQGKDISTILRTLSYPAFLVSNGTITDANSDAEKRFVEIGAKISTILHTGQEEYAEFTKGTLYLSICLAGAIYPCTVIALENEHLFRIRVEDSNAALQSLSLAAMQLNAPISEITLLIHSLTQTSGKDNSRLRQNLCKLRRILGNMADAGRYTSERKLSISHELVSVFDEILEKASNLLQQSGITLHYTLPTERIYTLVDPDLLRRAIYNMISNALKFSDNGKEVDITIKRINKRIYVTVRNETNGSAVPTGNIFHAYQRPASLESAQHGLGLGMTLVQSAASAHGGTVLIDQNNHQTRITMTIAIQQNKSSVLRSPPLHTDLYGGYDAALIELSDVLDVSLF